MRLLDENGRNGLFIEVNLSLKAKNDYIVTVDRKCTSLRAIKNQRKECIPTNRIEAFPYIEIGATAWQSSTHILIPSLFKGGEWLVFIGADEIGMH